MNVFVFVLLITVAQVQAGYQYQYAPEQPNARPFKAPEDYTPLDFKYQYVLKPSDNFKYKYQTSPGEFDFKFTPNPGIKNLTPERIKAESDRVASNVRDVRELFTGIKSDDIKTITGELGFEDFDLAGVLAGFNKIGDFIEKGGDALSQAETGIGHSTVKVKAPKVERYSVVPEPFSIAAHLGFPNSYILPIGRPIVYLFD